MIMVRSEEIDFELFLQQTPAFDVQYVPIGQQVPVLRQHIPVLDGQQKFVSAQHTPLVY